VADPGWFGCGIRRFSYTEVVDLPLRYQRAVAVGAFPSVAPKAVLQAPLPQPGGDAVPPRITNLVPDWYPPQKARSLPKEAPVSRLRHVSVPLAGIAGAGFEPATFGL
jgi:hypothetical protein